MHARRWPAALILAAVPLWLSAPSPGAAPPPLALHAPPVPPMASGRRVLRSLASTGAHPAAVVSMLAREPSPVLVLLRTRVRVGREGSAPALLPGYLRVPGRPESADGRAAAPMVGTGRRPATASPAKSRPRTAATSPPPGAEAVPAPVSGSPAPTSSPPSANSSPFVLGYYTQYTPTSAASQASLAAHAAQVTAIAPLWYSARADGTLHALGYQHAGVRAWCAARGVAIYPLVINGNGNDAILVNAGLRQQVIQALVDRAQADGYAGFNIDFEGLSNSDETGLDVFAADLARALHAVGKKLIVAVGPRTSNQNAYHAYNYQSLGRSADYVVLMTYDDHDNTSAPGPIAPMPWVDAVTRYAVAEMPASKILLGLAVYGYNWSANGAYEVHDPEAAAEAAQAGVPIAWDSAAAEATFTYVANGVTHTVWYENGYSDAFKIQLANQDHLGGVAIWRLGDEDEDLWTALRRLR